MVVIVKNGVKIESEIECWCGFSASLHHTSGTIRKDGKISVWYKCRNNHMTALDLNYNSSNIKEPKKNEKKVKKKDGKKKSSEVPT